MIIYNVTIKINLAQHDEWYQWMKEVHIPEVMATSYFIKSQMSKLLYMDESDGYTYTIQYYCKDLKTLEAYHELAAPALQKKHTEKFKDKYVAFRSIMDVHHDHEVE